MSQLNEQELLLGYVDGDLSPQDAAHFEKQMAGDRRLSQLAEQLRRDSQLLRDMPLEEPPVELVERIMHQRERDMLLGGAEQQPMRLVQPRPVRANRLAKFVAYGSIAAAIGLCASVVLIMLPDAQMRQKSTKYDHVNGQLAKRLEDINALERAVEAEDVAIAPVTAPSVEEPAAPVEETVATPTPIVRSKAGPPLPAMKIAAAKVGGVALKSRSRLVGRDDLNIDSDVVAQTYQLDGRTIPYRLAELTLPRNNFRVEITTDNAPVTFDELNRWALDNTVTLEPQDSSVAIDTPTVQRAGKMAQNAKAADNEITDPFSFGDRQEQVAMAERQQIIVVIEPQQVPQLLAGLNRRAGQRALLIADPDEQVAKSADVSGRFRPERELVAGNIAAPQVARAMGQARLAQQTEPVVYHSATFAWGSVLENQLPLVTQTSLDSLRSQAHLRLPIWINQDAPLQPKQD